MRPHPPIPSFPSLRRAVSMATTATLRCDHTQVLGQLSNHLRHAEIRPTCHAVRPERGRQFRRDCTRDLSTFLQTAGRRQKITRCTDIPIAASRRTVPADWFAFRRCQSDSGSALFRAFPGIDLGEMRSYLIRRPAGDRFPHYTVSVLFCSTQWFQNILTNSIYKNACWKKSDERKNNVFHFKH